MPIEAVKIPQNVYIEDRIIGPITLRQIIIMGIGAGISYIIFGSIQRAMGTVPVPLGILSAIPAAIAAIIALVKVNDLSITRVLLLLLEGTQKPHSRTWGPRQGISINIRTSAKPEEETRKKIETAPKAPEKSLRELSTSIDRLWRDETGTLIPTPPPADEHPSIETPQFTLPSQQDSTGTAAGSELPSSDLNVFRDLFPPTNDRPQ